MDTQLSQQTATAEVLSDIDEELADLEQRHRRTIVLKESMTQELLDGRTQLI